ncbi:MAG: phage holin family protein [Patescibacteria group bacterium]|nr:phage holin family protein [Patescibacteria group bacterium]
MDKFQKICYFDISEFIIHYSNIMVSKLIIQILTNSIAVFIAAKVVSGFTLIEDSFMTLLMIGFIFGLINFFIKPILKLISLPIILFTFGLFTIIINIAMLLLLDYFIPELTISGFWAAFWAMIVIGAVNIFIGAFSKK